MKKYFLIAMLGLVLIGINVGAQTADIDPNPSTQLCENFSFDLRVTTRDAQTNNQVSDLQYFLQTKGYLSSEPTGYFGLLTHGAVKSYQNANGIIPVSGFVGPITRLKINKEIGCTHTTPSVSSTTDVANSSVSKVQGCNSNALFNSLTGKRCKSEEITTVTTTTTKGTIAVTNPQFGDEYDNGPTQKIITSWKDYKGDFDYYQVYLLNNEANVGTWISDKVNKQSNSYAFIAKQATTLVEKLSGKAAPDGGYWLRVHAMKKEDLVGDSSAAEGASGVFSINNNNPVPYEVARPTISYVQGIAADRNEVYANEKASIKGKDLVYAGKDIRVFINETEAKVTQYNNEVVYFTAPDLPSGSYELVVQTTYGKSKPKKISFKNNKDVSDEKEETSHTELGRDLTVGSSGEDVTKLQKFLTVKGYFTESPLITYGYFGNSTREALARYQQSKGISPADGYFGVLTRVNVRAEIGE